MAKVQRDTVIHAPMKKIFDFLTEPSNLLEIWPSLVEIRDVVLLPEGIGSTYRWASKIAGMRFEGVTEVVEFVRGQKVVLKDTGGIAGTRKLTLQEEKDATRVFFESEYSLNIPMIGRLVETFVIKENEKETAEVLANLKSRMEKDGM